MNRQLNLWHTQEERATPGATLWPPRRRGERAPRLGAVAGSRRLFLLAVIVVALAGRAGEAQQPLSGDARRGESFVITRQGADGNPVRMRCSPVASPGVQALRLECAPVRQEPPNGSSEPERGEEAPFRRELPSSRWFMEQQEKVPTPGALPGLTAGEVRGSQRLAPQREGARIPEELRRREDGAMKVDLAGPDGAAQPVMPPAGGLDGGGETPFAAGPSRAGGTRQPLAEPGALEPERGRGGAAAAARRDARSAVERMFATAQDPNEIGAIRQFGYDLFAAGRDPFQSSRDLPVRDDHLVGPGDVYRIDTWGNLNESFEVAVDQTGSFFLPKVGLLPVAGLRFEQLGQYVNQRLQRYYSNFNLNIVPKRLRSIQVFVVGEVEAPGTYSLEANATAFHALFLSGGPTKRGSLRRIRLLRNGKVVQTIDLYRFLLTGDKTLDEPLRSGDTLFVPLIGHVVGVAGNVKRPGIYEFPGSLTLAEALDLSGGVTALGYLAKVKIERIEAHKRRFLTEVDLDGQQGSKEAREYEVADGDFVQIFSILPERRNSVSLAGHIYRPGEYQFQEGMRLRDLIPSAEVLKPEPYLDYAEIIRQAGPARARTILSFQPAEIFSANGHGKEANLPLQPGDQVRIFAAQEFQDLPKVGIEGEVRRPGFYELLPGMRVTELIKRAGNLTRTAYLDEAELLRRGDDHGLSYIRFNLRKGLQGDEKENPALEEQDRLVIHSVEETEFAKAVKVTGEVREPGVYPLAGNMTVRDLIFRAKGLSPYAYLPEAEITRRAVQPEGMEATRVTINLAKALEGEPAHNLPLRHLDVLMVRIIPDFGTEKTVTVEGEVRFPGVYALTKSDRISDLVERAGGFTADAYLPGSVFTRARVREMEQQRIEEMLKLQEREALRLSAEEASQNQKDEGKRKAALETRQRLASTLRSIKAAGRVVITLNPQEGLKKSKFDLMLEDGDRLLVPRIPKTVTLIGEVLNPATILHTPDQDAGYYLEKVGGYTEKANKSKLFIVRADGSVYAPGFSQASRWFATDVASADVQPGDTIVVPEKLDLKRFNFGDLRDLTTTVLSTAVLAGTAARIF
ncbi:MAG: SLBB domain-containing protein [Candidatus Tectomicrobia bacterium]|nr:SLBB domain-containing protein [Candidatus Tectomicrobia bacterium]